MTTQDRVTSSMNDSGTGSKTGTDLTQGRSGFDLENTRRELIAMREKRGADTPVGHRISNLIEQVENLRTATGEQREHLIRNIQKSMDDIKDLTPDQKN